MFDRYLNLLVLFLFFFLFATIQRLWTTWNNIVKFYVASFLKENKISLTKLACYYVTYLYPGTVNRRRKEITETCIQKRNCFFYFLNKTSKNVDAAKKRSFGPFAITSRIKYYIKTSFRGKIFRDTVNRVTVGEEMLVISYFVGFCLFFPTVNTENPVKASFHQQNLRRSHVRHTDVTSKDGSGGPEPQSEALNARTFLLLEKNNSSIVLYYFAYLHI